MTVSRTWKLAEQRLAALFGTVRRPLSGMNSRSGGRDDGMHETVYLENKLRDRHAVWSLFREVKEQAKKEGKVPVIGLQEKHKQGILLVIHSDDLPAVLEAYAEAQANGATDQLDPQPAKPKRKRPIRRTTANP